MVIIINIPTEPPQACKTALVPIRKPCHFLADGFQIAVPTRVNNISSKPKAVYTLSYPLSQATCCEPGKQVLCAQNSQIPYH